jgi:metal-sulfur cluster biosynthetic enzyme
MNGANEEPYVEGLWDALREVVDPEIGINVVDLGLVYSVEHHDRDVRVAMTMTTEACPLHEYLAQAAEAAIRRRAPELARIAVDIVWEPAWTPAMMSDSAKRLLGWST